MLFLVFVLFVSFNKMRKKKTEKKPQTEYCFNCFLGNLIFEGGVLLCNLYFVICSKHHLLLKGEMIVSMPNLLWSCVGFSQLFIPSVCSQCRCLLHKTHFCKSSGSYEIKDAIFSFSCKAGEMSLFTK